MGKADLQGYPPRRPHGGGQARTHTLAGIGVVASTVAIAAADLLTGDEIRMFPLYFLPLTLVAWHFGRAVAVAASILLSLVWLEVYRVGGGTYSNPSIWIINFVAQAATFLTVSLLVIGLRRAMRRERELSRTDELTGLPNRRSFLEEGKGVVALCRRHGWPATLAYVDLDNFKLANDRRGHEYGDGVLRRVAEVITTSLRGSDLTGRIGGDEFVVLLPETTPESAAGTLEKVRALLDGDPLLRGAGVTASIGAINYAPAPPDLDEMMRAADEVMYRVKGTTKNRVQVEERRE